MAGILTTPAMTFEEFVALGNRCPDLRMEQEPNGQIIIMPPVLSGSGYRESEANGFVLNGEEVLPGFELELDEFPIPLPIVQRGDEPAYPVSSVIFLARSRYISGSSGAKVSSPST